MSISILALVLSTTVALTQTNNAVEERGNVSVTNQIAKADALLTEFEKTKSIRAMYVTPLTPTACDAVANRMERAPPEPPAGRSGKRVFPVRLTCAG
jgi:hypothetical protein